MIFSPQEQLGPGERERMQSERLAWTVRHAYGNVPFYRAQLDSAGIQPEGVQGLSDLTRLPFTRKQHLRENYPFGLLAVPLDQVARIHASSGTRGKPTVVGYTRGDLDIWADCCARSLALAGAVPGQMLHNAYGYGLFTGGLGLHQGGERLGVTVVPMSGGNTPRQAMLLKDFGAQGICCTPSYLLNIADALDAAGIGPSDLRLRYAVLGAEPWTEEMRQQIERRIGIDAVDIYGLSEVIGPGVACECREEKQGLHVMEDHFLVEIVDPDTGDPLPEGETGELVVTSLTKEAFPVIRYRTGDLTSLRRTPCSCGRTTARISRIKGRSDDMLIVRGVNVFPSEIEAVVLSVAGLSPHYEIVVQREHNLDVLRIRVELAPEAAREAAPGSEGARALGQEVARRLRGELSLGVDVELLAPGQVSRSEGKAVRVRDLRGLAG